MSDLSERLRIHCGNDYCEPCIKCAQIMQEAADELDRLLAIEREYNICRDRVAEIASRESEQHVEQRREIDRLQAIVDRLPKTADGVPIYPGMILWTTYDTAMVTVEWFCRSHANNRWIMSTDRGSRTEEECYSTREAAEKAREP